MKILSTLFKQHTKQTMSDIVMSFVSERNVRLRKISQMLTEGRVDAATCKVHEMHLDLKADVYSLLFKLRKVYTTEEVLDNNYDIYLYVQNNLHVGCQSEWRNSKTHYLYNEFLTLLRQDLGVCWHSANGRERTDTVTLFYNSARLA